VKYGIEASDAAKEIGFMNGDKILSVDNLVVEDFFKIIPTIALESAKSVQVEREGKVVNIDISEDDIAKMLKAKKMLGLRYPFHIVINSFAKESPAQKAGMLKGDELVMVNHQTFEFHDQYASFIKAYSGKELLFTVKRGNDTIDFPVTLTQEGMLGISFDQNFSNYFEFKTIKYGFLASIPAGIVRGWETSTDYLKQFKLIFSRKTKGYESLGGFITIGSIFPSIWNWQSFWNTTAFLSIILAIMNILPIPALDGGHVLFVLYEMITGRKPNEKFLEYAQIAGLILLLLLVLYANANDVIKLFNK
jgi:regulator of sigma E protease